MEFRHKAVSHPIDTADVPRYRVVLPSAEVITYTDSAPAGGLPVLLAIHGLKGSDQGLARILAPVSMDHQVRVISLNLPGMGTSPARRDSRYDLNALIAIVCEFIQCVTFGEAVILVGHSFGATVASGVAGAWADATSGLILVSPVVFADAELEGPSARFRFACARAYSGLLRHGGRRIATSLCSWDIPGAVSNILWARRGVAGIRRIREFSRESHSLPVDAFAYASQLRAASLQGCMGLTATIRVPTYVIAGDRDQLSDAERLRGLATAVGGRCLLIRGAGHLAHHEDFDVVGNAVAACATAVARDRVGSGSRKRC